MVLDTAPLSYPLTPLSIFPLVDFFTNGYFLFQFNPLAQLLTLFWNNYTSYICGSLFVSLIGAAFLFAKPAQRKIDFFQLSLFSLFWLFLFLIKGFSLIDLNTLACLSLLVPAIRSYKGTFSLSYIAALTLSALVTAFSFNQAGLIVFLSALILFAREGFFALRANRLFILTLSVFVFIQTQVSLPNLPDYPQRVNVIPGYEVYQSIDPVIGTQFSIPVVNRDALEMYGSYFLFVLGALVLFFGTQKKREDKVFFGFLVFSFFGFLFKLFPDIFTLSPFAVLGRVVPSLAYFPIESVFLIIILFYLLSFESQKLIGITCALILTAAHLIAGSETFSKLPQFASILHHAEQKNLPITLVNSPSLFILSYHQIYSRSELARQAKEIPDTFDIAPFVTKSIFSPKQQLGESMLKGESPRWATGHVGQHGDEKVILQFQDSIELSGLDLSLPNFVSDFPRGIRVTTANDCASETHPQTILYEQKKWVGSVSLTENGYPYFTGQNHIRLYFRKSERVSCLMISQTGLDPVYDWSIEKIQGIR